MLDSYLEKVEELEEKSRSGIREQNDELQKEILKLHSVIEKKDEEIEDLFQEAKTAQKMAARIDEVYAEFEQLQEKMMLMLDELLRLRQQPKPEPEERGANVRPFPGSRKNE